METIGYKDWKHPESITAGGQSPCPSPSLTDSQSVSLNASASGGLYRTTTIGKNLQSAEIFSTYHVLICIANRSTK